MNSLLTFRPFTYVLAFFTSLWSQMPVAETFRVATGEWVPYVSEDYPHQGAIGHVIETIFARAGIETAFGYYPWARGYQMVKDGLLDGTMPYYCSAEREEEFYCSLPIVEGQQVFFHLKSYDFDWKTIADLKGLNVGATLGYYYGEAFEAAEKQGVFQSHRVGRDETNFLVMSRHRIQVFPQDRDVGYAMIRRLFNAEEQALFTHHPTPLHTKSLHLIFPRTSANSERYLKIFNTGLTKMRQSGELARYLEDMRAGRYEQPAPAAGEAASLAR